MAEERKQESGCFTVAITPRHDCVIFATARSTKPGAEGADSTWKKFLVRRQTVSGASEVLEARMRPRLDDTGGDRPIQFGDISAEALEVILRVLHEDDTVEHGDTELAHVWELAAKIETFGMTGSMFRDWFRAWCGKNQDLKHRPAQELLLLARKCDYCEAFQQLLRTLVYNSFEPIVACKQASCPQLQLSAGVVDKLNAARTTLKSLLHKHLYSDLHTTLDKGVCPIQAQHAFNYHKELVRLGCWPGGNILAEGIEPTKSIECCRIYAKSKLSLKTLPIIVQPARPTGRAL